MFTVIPQLLRGRPEKKRGRGKHREQSKECGFAGGVLLTDRRRRRRASRGYPHATGRRSPAGASRERRPWWRMLRVVVKRTAASRAVSGGRRCDGRLSPCGRKIKVIKDHVNHTLSFSTTRLQAGQYSVGTERTRSTSHFACLDRFLSHQHALRLRQFQHLNTSAAILWSYSIFGHMWSPTHFPFPSP